MEASNNGNGVAAVTVTPLPPDAYRADNGFIGTNGNGKPQFNSNGNGTPKIVPEDAGARIPIAIQSNNGNGRTNGNGRSNDATPAPMPSANDNSPMAQRFRAAQAAIPNVMADEPVAEFTVTELEPPAEPDIKPLAERSEPLVMPGDTARETANRLRPRTIRMQIRFFYTLAFAIWLFGRLVFWQVYVSRWFPRWVNNRNTKRWQKYAKEFRGFAQRLGGVHIKAGQFASTRADILPEEVIAELVDLQDKVPTIPYKRIKRAIVGELGDIDARFDWIDEDPIAAASLGQVHRAQLKENGKRVVVKVQRPNIRDVVYTDLSALFIVGEIAMKFNFVSRRADANQIIEEFGRVLLEEVSYIKEQENAERFDEMFADNDKVYVPKIYSEHSTDKLLTIEDVTSIKIDDYERLAAAGIDRKDVAQRLMDTYLQQIFEDRFFHADPHPGNLFVYPLPVDGEEEARYIRQGGGRPYYLIFIDFGMTSTLTRELVQGLVNTLTAVITRDAKKLAQSYLDLGFLLPSADIRRIEEAIKVVFDQVWGLDQMQMRNMDYEVVDNIGREFNDLLYDLPFRVPQDFVYLGRTVSILGGMATKLDPEFNPWVEIQERVQKLVTTDADSTIFDEIGKIVEDSINEILVDGPQGFIRVAQRVANQFQRVDRAEQLLEQIVNGEVAIETKTSPQQKRQLERLEIQGKRNARMVTVGTLLICATVLYTNGDMQLAIGALSLAGVGYVSSVFIN